MGLPRFEIPGIITRAGCIHHWQIRRRSDPERYKTIVGATSRRQVVAKMKQQTTHRITLLLLLLGFVGAAVIFITAKPEKVDSLLGDYRSSKRYQRELKMMGGEANVLVDEFQGWFADQWHGKNLARTVVVITIGTTLFFRLLASHPDYAGEKTDERVEERMP